MLRRWTQRERVHAIHERDLESILTDLGLLDEILAGSLYCSLCDSPLTLDTIQCLYMDEDNIRLCCTRVDCYERLLLEKGRIELSRE